MSAVERATLECTIHGAESGLWPDPVVQTQVAVQLGRESAFRSVCLRQETGVICYCLIKGLGMARNAVGISPLPDVGSPVADC